MDQVQNNQLSLIKGSFKTIQNRSEGPKLGKKRPILDILAFLWLIQKASYLMKVGFFALDPPS